MSYGGERMTIKKKVTSKASKASNYEEGTLSPMHEAEAPTIGGEDRRTLDAIPILIEFARKMRQVPIEEVSRAAGKALREWDKARG
jgi:hypothetical protein